MRTAYLANAATAVLAVCAVVVTGLVVRRELFPAAAPPDEPRSAVVSDWRRYAVDGRSSGPDDAPVTLTIFSDFQCPACRILAGSVDELRRSHQNALRVVYRHYPLPSHSFAVPAARASECAGYQDRFQALHDALFARQEEIGVLPWSDFARTAGVPDIPSFERCMDEDAPKQSLERDIRMGRRLGVDRTPTVLLNHTRIDGAPPLAVLERHVRQALAEAGPGRPAAVSIEAGPPATGPD